MDCCADRKPYTTKLSLTACNESSFACDTGWSPLYILSHCSSMPALECDNYNSYDCDNGHFSSQASALGSRGDAIGGKIAPTEAMRMMNYVTGKKQEQ